MNNRLIKNFLFVFLLFSCNQDDATGEPPTSIISPISTKAKNFLNEFVDIVEANSINRHKINWVDFRDKVFEKVEGAQTIANTYPGIREALIMLGDNHSFLTKPDGTLIFAGNLKCNSPSISTPSLPGNVGYVKVNSFSGPSNNNAAISFAEGIQNQIRSNDHSEVIGWIVDIRGNRGGNMWPMLAGIGPILGEGNAGYFIDADDNQTSWGFQDGSSLINGIEVTELNNSYELITPDPKVAVLLDSGIASSGEVIAISFIGREDTKSFGSSTCGLSTSNESFILSDNSTLNLTTAYLADRNKNLYGIPVNPDFVVTNEKIIQNVLEWIEN